MLMTKYQYHHFDDTDDVIVTVLLPTGDYGAWRDGIDEGKPIRAWGASRIGAIADLIEYMKEEDEDA